MDVLDILLDIHDTGYFGHDPNAKILREGMPGFREHPNKKLHLQTPIDQPGPDIGPCVFPADPVGMMLYYFSYKNDQKNIANAESNKKIPHPHDTSLIVKPGLVYDHNVIYDKHKQAKNGKAYWPNASVNPIPDLKTGQKLLETSFQLEGKTWKANYFNGKVIKFQTSNDGFWHAYEIHNKVVRDLNGSKLLDAFKQAGLFSQTEYKKLLKR